MAGGARAFTTSSFIIRMLLALFVVLSAYNPTGYSYVHWLTGGEGGFVSKVVVGIIIFSLNVLFLVMAIDALKLLGISIVLVNYAAIVWWLHATGMIDFWRPATMWMSLLVGLATIHAAGLSYSLWLGRLSGLLHVSKY